MALWCALSLLRRSSGTAAAATTCGDLLSHLRKFSHSRVLETKDDGGGWLPLDHDFPTIAVHSGYDPKEHPNGPLVPPISLSTTFEQEAPGKFKGHHYIRISNPTRINLERTLAALDKGKYAFAYSSGMAAILNVVSLLKPGDGMVVIDDVYGGTNGLFTQFAQKFGIVLTHADLCDPTILEKELKPNTKMIWVETPTNPTLKIIDIQKIVDEAKRYSKDIIVAVDNTTLSSFLQKPLSLGADLSVCSLTKYVNGHTDVLMGAVVTNREDLRDQLAFFQNALGAVPSPFDCYQVLRGLKTLHVRMPLHMKNSLEVAKFLEGHPKVGNVFHPGLPSHPHFHTARRQASGHSGMVSFTLKKEGTGSIFVHNLRLIKLATSFGGFESMVEVPIHGSKATVNPELRARLGITEDFIRLSVGLESVNDIIADLENALRMC